MKKDDIKQIQSFSNVGNRIKIQLEKKGLKQADLCKLTGISTNGMSQYITGKRVPDTVSTFKIAKALDVTMEWLLVGFNDSHSCNFFDNKADDAVNKISVTEKLLLNLFSKLNEDNQNIVVDFMEKKLQEQFHKPAISKNKDIVNEGKNF